MSLERIRSRAKARRLGSYAPNWQRGVCFIQGDQAIANQAGAAFRSDLNNELQALVTFSQGATAPGTTYRNMIWHDTTANVIKQRNAANAAWIVKATLDETFVLARSSNTILGLSDIGKAIVATSGFTQTFTAAATLGDGWWVPYRANSGATMIFDPNASENIDGATTKTVVGPASGIIYCNGSNFFTVGFDQPAATQSVAGVLTTATQAQQETGSSTAVAVSPGVQQYHPSAAKWWVNFDTNGVIAQSYNVSSITDTAVGNLTVNLTTGFSGGQSQAAFASPHTHSQGTICQVGLTSATQINVFQYNAMGTGTKDDGSGRIFALGFGDQ